MGSSSSSPRPAGAALARPSRAPTLARTGRYTTLASSSGAVLHVLGVFPCSSVSAEEAEDLIAAVRPSVVYVGVHPEILAVLEADVRAGRMVDAGWRIPEQAPPFRRYDDAGWLVSVNIRNLLADNEMLGLLGAEALLPFKAAVRAALALPPPPPSSLTGVAAPTSSVSALTAPPGADAPRAPAQLLSFPMSMQYNNGETLDQPAHLAHIIVGNASTGSTALTALVGNPSSWFYDAPAAAAAAAAAEAATAAAAAAAATAAASGAPPPAPPLPPPPAVVAKPDVDFTCAIPEDTGYFTRGAVQALQADFRQLVNRACAAATASSLDLESDLLARETRARADGQAEAATAFSTRAMTSQKQSQAVAFHIQGALDAAAQGGPGAGGTSPPAVGVAIVNLGAMASLQRNWAEARPAQELFPPHTAAQEALGNVLPAALGACALYGVYRGFRRFPRSTAVVVGALGLSTGAIVYSAIHGDWTRYGAFVRSSLARPRITSPLARVNR